MDNSKVPQHNISTHAETTKVVYALDENGEYTAVASSGWDVEEDATRQALGEFKRLADSACDQVRAGLKSPLYFHMYDRRMDLQTLAQATGFFRWRIKRHFKPEIFNRLPDRILACYGEALGIRPQELCRLPGKGQHSD